MDHRVNPQESQNGKNERICISNQFKLFQKHNKAVNPFTPNRILYVILLICSLLLIGSSAFVSQQCFLFTIISGIGCGGLASAVIAWLIDEANAKTAAKKSKLHRQILFKKLTDSFDHGLQILILSAKEHLTDCNDRKWFEWVEDSHKLIETDPSFAKDYLTSLRVFFGDVVESILEIQSQDALLLEYGIIDKTDIDAFKVIISICDMAERDYHSEKEEKLIDHVTTYCGLLRGLIGYSNSLRHINDMIVEPYLYNTAVEKGIMKTNQN